MQVTADSSQWQSTENGPSPQPKHSTTPAIAIYPTVASSFPLANGRALSRRQSAIVTAQHHYQQQSSKQQKQKQRHVDRKAFNKISTPDIPSSSLNWVSKQFDGVSDAKSTKTRPLRSRTRARRLFACVALIIVAYLALLKLAAPYNLYAGRALDRDWHLRPISSQHTSTSLPRKEPRQFTSEEAARLDDIIVTASEQWKAKVAKQSKTAEEAVQEYIRRYEMAPPEGFEEWFEYAKESGIELVDEYDSLMHSLDPFRRLSTSELQYRTIEIGSSPSFSLVNVLPQAGRGYKQLRPEERISVQSPPVGIVQKRAYSLGQLLVQLLQEKERPGLNKGVSFAVNEIADPRVLLSWEAKHDPEVYLDTNQQDAPFSPITRADWGAGETTANAYARSCDPSANLRRSFASIDTRVKHFTLASSHAANVTHPFAPIKSIRAAPHLRYAQQVAARQAEARKSFLTSLAAVDETQMCSGSDYLQKHGLFYSDWRIIDTLYPVFSHSTVPGFSDILIPNFHHRDFPGVFEREPVLDWAERAERLYWRGTADGGGNRPSGRQLNYQRQRFVALANSIAESRALSDNGHQTSNVDHLDVAFDDLTGCGEAATCEALLDNSTYRINRGRVVQEFAQVKMTADLDGNAYSSRLSALLESGAAVVKSSLYKEYFADHLQAWYHVIPLSLKYDEFSSILTYFFGSTGSPSSLKAVTRQSKSGTSSTSYERHIGNDAALQAIAERGREWGRQYMGEQAAKVYAYRLALEWSRLYNGDSISVA